MNKRNYEWIGLVGLLMISSNTVQATTTSLDIGFVGEPIELPPLTP